MASLDVLALLPGPPTKVNAGSACLHDGQLFAYGASSAVIVVDVQKLCIATTLVGLHRNAGVTSLAWHPGLGPRDPKGTAQLRLASGDDEGRVVVWNATAGSAVAVLEDPLGAAFPGARRAEGVKPSVQGLAWVTAIPSLLAILIAPGFLILWDFRANSILWRKDLLGGSGSEVFTSIQVDALDRRQFCVCGNRGTFVVLKATNPALDKVKQQQYQVDIGQQGTLRCAFATTHDLLFVLLQREIIVFDLEFGQPAASTSLPASRPPFEGLLGSFGHAAAGKAGRDGGIDVLYCSHTDGSFSVWQRNARLLTYGLVGSTRLLPPAPKFSSGRGPQLVALAAGLWGGLQPELAGDAAAQLSAVVQPPAQPQPQQHPSQPTCSGWNPFETEPEPLALANTNPFEVARGEAASIATAAGRSRAATAMEDVDTTGSSAQGAGRRISVVVMGACDEGQVWQWQLPLLEGTMPSPKPPMPRVELQGLLQNLSNKVTNFTVCAAPAALPLLSPQGQQVVAAIAAATAAGNIELVTVQQGTLSPLHATMTASMAAHKGTVPGMRWLGSSPRIVSYSTEKTAAGYRNTLLITDVRNRVSMPVRDSPNDSAPILAVRGSPTGRYLLVIFRGLPSEIWSVGGGDKPVRLRQIDLQFTAVEWMGEVPLSGAQGSAGVAPAGGTGPLATWEPSTLAQQRAAEGYPVAPEGYSPRDDMPDERLAFALVDGRVGVLAIKGRRIQDTHPKRPVWLPLATGEYRATAVAGWNHLVFLGDAEGGLVKWDTSTGRTFVMETAQGKIHKIYVAPGPCASLHSNAAAVQARVAVLYSTGTFAVYDLDHSNELRPTIVTANLVSARLGKVADVEWLPLPAPVGGGSVLVVSLADGTLELVDTIHSTEIRPRQQRLLRYKTVLNYDQGAPLPRLAPGIPTASPLLLPRSWILLLRVLLQRGVDEATFKQLAALASISQPSSAGTILGRTLEAEQSLEQLENDIWSRLPLGCHVAWENLLARHSEGSEVPSSPAEGSPGVGAEGGSKIARILDDFADTAEEDIQSLDAAIAASQGLPPPPQDQPEEPMAVPGSAPPPPWVRKPRRPRPPVSGSSKNKREPVINFKSIGGAFAAMATVSKSQLSKTFGLGSRAGQGGPMSPSNSALWDGQDAPQAKAAFQCLITVLQAAGYLRGLSAVLSASELATYQQALADRCTAGRMAVAASLGGCPAEAQFWARLPVTLRWLSGALQQARSRTTSQAEEAPRQPPSQRPGSGNGHTAASPYQHSNGGGLGASRPSSAAGQQQQEQQRHSDQERLWVEARQLAEESERSAWHEQMPRSVFENSEQLQEKRVLRYVALGDFHTAVGFLLASGPESTARYYRNALCTLAMSFACGTQQAQQGDGASLPGTAGPVMVRGPGGSGGDAGSGDNVGAIESAAARTLFSQAAKVITANAASVGDSLLGVPLLCSTGQHPEAVHILQDAGLWHYAAALIASRLQGSDRAAALERWAGHVAAAEGRPWAAAGLLVTAGALKSALQLLRQAGLPDAAFALIAACREAHVPVEQHNLDTGELQNLFPPAGGPVRRFNSDGERQGELEVGGQRPRRTQTDYEANDTAKEFQLYICEVLQQL